MLICIPKLFDKAEVAAIREKIDNAIWIDGNITAGAQSSTAKKNKQIDETNPIAREIGNQILDRLGQSQLFVSAALPLKTFPPLFNKYEIGDGFGIHIDNAIRPIKGTALRIRTDLSMTIFFSEPDDYDGGELEIETSFGTQSVKLNAGDAVLYPSSSLHKVNEITRGARISSFFWIQSMVRDENARTILFDLDQSIQNLAQNLGHKSPEIIRLTGIYHNLIRQWADA